MWLSHICFRSPRKRSQIWTSCSSARASHFPPFSCLLTTKHGSHPVHPWCTDTHRSVSTVSTVQKHLFGQLYTMSAHVVDMWVQALDIWKRLSKGTQGNGCNTVLHHFSKCFMFHRGEVAREILAWTLQRPWSLQSEYQICFLQGTHILSTAHLLYFKSVLLFNVRVKGLSNC